VAVYERADRIGGLLRYGIPEFKMEKRHLDRRLAQMEAEGTRFRPGVASATTSPAASCATVRRGRARRRRDGLARPRRPGPRARRRPAGHAVPAAREPARGRADASTCPSPTSAPRARTSSSSAAATPGADCLGTALRQGARSVTQLEIMPRPPQERPDTTPWPTWPLVYRTEQRHEEGGERLFSVNTSAFVASRTVTGLELVDVELVDGRFEPVEGSERVLPAQLVLLAMGFTGPQRTGCSRRSSVELDGAATSPRRRWATSVPGVFVAGDMGSWQSLIVWAIAEGRSGGGASTAPVRRDVAARAHRADRPAARRLTADAPPPPEQPTDRPDTHASRQDRLHTRARRRGRMRELVEAGMDVARLNLSHGATPTTRSAT
jgi:glutamate synthase (NADPH/NADH) small chain